MSKALDNFKIAIEDAKQLLDCYDAVNSQKFIPEPEILKRAALIMSLTAWETYIEDVATEIFKTKFSVLSGSHVGIYIQNNLEIELSRLHNPDSAKTKKLFLDFFGIDVTEQWSISGLDSTEVRTQLNKWLKKRGDAVHRAKLDNNSPHIVKRDELEKCIRFLTQLAHQTDLTLSNI